MKPLAERLSDRKLISHGDISSAYRARDKRLDRDVFLKILHPHFAQDDDLRARFEREARAAAKIDHPQLVRIYEVGEDPAEGPFMLLEWVEGETLSAKIKRERTLSVDQVRTLALSLLNGLASLHANGILHRDIKPDNILCRNDGVYKLTDFSLALLVDAPKLTYHNAVVGTPAYLAPELARGKAPSERSDLFAIGVVLYEAATGHNPFASDALLESLRRVREEEPDWKLLDNLSSDRALVLLIKSFLEKEAEDRPASASSAASLLNGDVTSVKLSQARGTRKNVFFVAAALFSVVVAIVLWPNGSNEPATQMSMSIPVSPDTAEVVQNYSDSTKPVVANAMDDVPERVTVPKPEVRKKTDSASSSMPLDTALQQPDSFELFLDTVPWAHVTLAGVELGTTPLGRSITLARGSHVFMLRNPAFPPIIASIDVSADTRKQIELARFVQHIELNVEPWGEVILDNEKIGTTPLNKLMSVLPGNHTLRITHPTLPAVEKSWQAQAGDTLKLKANLQTSELAIRTSGDKN